MPDVVEINSAYYGSNISKEQELAFFGRRGDQMVYQDSGNNVFLFC